MDIKKNIAKTFPDSIAAWEYDVDHGTNFSGVNSKKTPKTNRMTSTNKMNARFGRGSFAGKTGDPFIDDPFFNPWAKGGAFNK